MKITSINVAASALMKVIVANSIFSAAILLGFVFIGSNLDAYKTLNQDMKISIVGALFFYVFLSVLLYGIASIIARELLLSSYFSSKSVQGFSAVWRGAFYVVVGVTGLAITLNLSSPQEVFKLKPFVDLLGFISYLV